MLRCKSVSLGWIGPHVVFLWLGYVTLDGFANYVEIPSSFPLFVTTLSNDTSLVRISFQWDNGSIAGSQPYNNLGSSLAKSISFYKNYWS